MTLCMTQTILHYRPIAILEKSAKVFSNLKQNFTQRPSNYTCIRYTDTTLIWGKSSGLYINNPLIFTGTMLMKK